MLKICKSRILSASAKGRTALLDAIYLGLSEMRTARNAKRALLIISDGGDNNSRYNERDIKRLVREADTQLYSIGTFARLCTAAEQRRSSTAPRCLLK